ncbi:integrase core domain-containing protein [Streptomyces sp. NPDC051956]|uniref:integrase core domain-containing protein n=1 Tax=Streptomyces sp. NPDC051956 TaxID=3365677 RepID=UPI0037D882DE
MEILMSAPRAPRMNAHCERVIGSIRREVLDHVLIMNEAHARQVLATYERRRPAAPSAPDAHARCAPSASRQGLRRGVLRRPRHPCRSRNWQVSSPISRRPGRSPLAIPRR